MSTKKIKKQTVFNNQEIFGEKLHNDKKIFIEEDILFCPFCGIENSPNTTFCKKCGRGIKNQNSEDILNNLNKNDIRYKKISIAGFMAEAFGWFSLISSSILIFTSTKIESSYSIFDLILALIIAIILIKYGRKIKTVKYTTLKDVVFLIWTTVVVVSINLLILLITGEFAGWFFLILFYYLFQAKSVFKKL